VARVAEEFQRDPGRILKAAASCNSQRGSSNSKGPVASRVQRNILGLSGIFTVPDRGWPLSNVKTARYYVCLKLRSAPEIGLKSAALNS
jgi:hypothetical protein